MPANLMAETLPGQEFDYVIVGAGSAGSALAARLSEDADVRILLLEAGPAGAETSTRWLRMPLGFGRVVNDPRLIWPFSTSPEPALAGRRLFWPRGKMLGGSSGINGLLWARGDAADYNRWRDADCPGWGYQDVLPTLKRMENRPGGDPETRGAAGPISVEDVRHRDVLSDAFIEGCQAQGAPWNDDYNAGDTSGTSLLQLLARNGQRQTTADAYLTPSAGRMNLTVRTGATARRLVFDGHRVAGVVYGDSGSEQTVVARREVILCAGSIRTPQLLELSGIGQVRHLKSIGIAVRKDLPGVGENLQDHLTVRATYECAQPITINDILNSKRRSLQEALRYRFRKTGLFATPSATVQTLLASRDGMERPDIRLQLGHVSGEGGFTATEAPRIDPHSGFTIGLFMLRPASRGSVHVRSADPDDDPAMVANYLAEEGDIATTLAGVKMVRSIAAHPAMQRLIIRETRPGADIADDEALIAWMRETGQPGWHQAGTCRMGQDNRAVVGPDLKVHGVGGLRVADASVMPHLVSSNIHAPTILIGERCADFIRNEWR